MKHVSSTEYANVRLEKHVDDDVTIYSVLPKNADMPIYFTHSVLIDNRAAQDFAKSCAASLDAFIDAVETRGPALCMDDEGDRDALYCLMGGCL